MKTLLCIAAFTVFPLGLKAQVPGTAASSEPQKGDAYLQILNGAGPQPITFMWEGGPVYENIGPGTRISALSVPSGEMRVKVKDTHSGAEKVIKLQIEPKTSNTLCFTGNFAPLPRPAGADPKLPLDYHLKAAMFKNEKPDGSKVNVRVINGLEKKPLTISTNKPLLTVPPGEVGIAKDLHPELILKASDGSGAVTLYLAQASNPLNLTVIFYEKDGQLAFRATTEDFQ